MIFTSYMAKEEILETKICILKEVAETIVSTDNLDSITNLILDLALNYTQAKSGSILLLEDEDDLVIKAARGMDSGLASALRLKSGENICGKVALERKPLLVINIDNDERIQKKGATKYETKSFISCPILMKDKLLGVINVSDKIDGTPFVEDELDLINILANQAAITLENANLMSELHSKTIEMDDVNKGLIETDRLKTEFVTRISHELRTPLNSIKGAVYYLKENGARSKEEKKEFIEIISNETSKLITLLEGLLDFSRVEREGDLLKKKVINLNDVVKDSIATKTVKDLLAEKKLSILPVYHDLLSDIIADRTRIFQLIINIIGASTRYAVKGDLIELKTVEAESSVELEFFIKGRQIPDNELSLMFDINALWSWSDMNHDNLKFYLAKKTIELHKGTISSFNTSEGITIKLAIPKSIKERRDAEITELMNLFLSFAAKSMGLNQCSLMLADELTGDLTIKSAYGMDEEIIRRTRLRLGDKIAGWVAIEKTPLLIKNIEKDSRIGKKSSARYNTKSLLCLPVIVQEKVVGVLNLNNKESKEPFTTRDLYIAKEITKRLSYMLEKSYTGNIKGKDFKMITRRMDTLLSAEEKYGKKNREMIDLVHKLMKHLGCSEDKISMALYTSALYDLGLTQIDESILKKKRKLTALEKRIIKTHPFSGVGLIDHIEFSDTIKKIILHHHEWYDGKGYPDGLKGKEIPFVSRVLAVVDAYIAMITDQSYRKAVTREKAVRQIMSCSGTQFDPKIVDAFHAITRKKAS